MTTITHIPDGFMCCVCRHALMRCNHLEFTKMRILETDKNDGVKTVKCTDFERSNG